MSRTEAEDSYSVKTRPVKWKFGSCFVSGLIIFSLGYFFSIVSGINMADESWFLQVVHRVTSGDVLYRDVFCGYTPLSVYLTAVFTTIFGTEILVLKAMMSLCLVFTVLLSCRIVRQLGGTEGFPFLFVVALIVYAPPGASGMTTPLANLFFLGCFSAALMRLEISKLDNGVYADRSKSKIVLAVAGVAAGLCFVTKQNIGLYALSALLLTVIVGSRGLRWSGRRLFFDIVLILTAFILASVLVLLPVWLSGGAEKFLDYGFLNKGTYLRLGRLSYLEELSRLAIFPSEAGTFKKLQQLYWLTPFLLPLMTFGALLVTRLRSGPDKRGVTITVFLFVGAAFIGIFPRVDNHHLIYAIPELLIGLVYAWHRLRPCIAKRWDYLVRAGLVLWLGAGMCFMLMYPYIKIASGNYQPSTLPHFRGALIDVSLQNEIYTNVKILKEIAKSDQPFLLSPYAGFYYLVAGLKNPTPFDYPLATAFGRNGESEVIAAISRRQIRTVCLDYRGLSHLTLLRAEVLERFVQEYMERSLDLGFCTLYHSCP